MALTALELYNDESLQVSEVDCYVCKATLMIYMIPTPPPNYSLSPETPVNFSVSYFHCGICGTRFYSTTEVIKNFTMRKL